MLYGIFKEVIEDLVDQAKYGQLKVNITSESGKEVAL